MLGKIACPNCQQILRSAQAPPLGKKVKCPRCGTPFLVTDEEVRRAEDLDGDAALPAPAAAAAPAPAAPPGDPRLWYYASPGEEPNGPCSWDELKQFVAGGKLRGRDLVWREGLGVRR